MADPITADQQKMQKAVEEMQALSKEAAKLAGTISKYDAQLQENEVVKKELELLEPEGRVFKLMGPVLVPQDLVEATSNVDKRIGFISDELKRMQKKNEQLSADQEDAKGKIIAMQTKMQKKAQQAQQAQAGGGK